MFRRPFFVYFGAKTTRAVLAKTCESGKEDEGCSQLGVQTVGCKTWVQSSQKAVMESGTKTRSSGDDEQMNQHLWLLCKIFVEFLR